MKSKKTLKVILIIVIVAEVVLTFVIPLGKDMSETISIAIILPILTLAGTYIVLATK